MNKKILYTLFGFILLTVISLIYIYKANINVIYYSDTKYMPYMMTSIYSIKKNKYFYTRYNIYVIAEGFNYLDKQKLKSFENNSIKIHIIPAKEQNLDYIHLGRFQPFKPAMQKIFIPEYLKDVNKAIYLDADTIVQKDLIGLYNKDVKDVYIAASRDGLMFMYPEHIEEVGLKWRNFYFNSGVMLLNLQKMREDDFVKQSIKYFHTHQEVFADQDILNVVSKNKVKEISYKYNCNSTFFEENDAKFLSKFFNEEVPANSQEVYKNAVILHFAGHKPWTEWFVHPYLKPLWWQYAKEVSAKYNIDY